MSPEYNEPTPATVEQVAVEEVPTTEQANFEIPVSIENDEVVESSTPNNEINPTREAATHAAAMLAINQEAARAEVAQATQRAAVDDWSQDRLDSVTGQIKAKFETH